MVNTKQQFMAKEFRIYINNIRIMMKNLLVKVFDSIVLFKHD